MKLSDGIRIVFTGDSITDGGRRCPVGRAPELGSGYVAQVDTLLGATYPERAIEVLNTGISGNRVPDLANRWRTDTCSSRARSCQPSASPGILGAQPIYATHFLPVSASGMTGLAVATPRRRARAIESIDWE